MAILCYSCHWEMESNSVHLLTCFAWPKEWGRNDILGLLRLVIRSLAASSQCFRMLVLGKDSCHVGNLTTLRPLCCEKAQATHKEGSRRERERCLISPWIFSAQESNTWVKERYLQSWSPSECKFRREEVRITHLSTVRIIMRDNKEKQ